MEYPFKTKPYQHQLDCWLKSRDLTAYALFMEMGTGKTKVIIDTAAYLYDNGKIDNVLVVANKGSYANWENSEFPAHLPAHVPCRILTWSSAWPKKKVDELLLWLKQPERFPGLRVLVMNTEALAYTRSRAVAEKFVVSGRTLMVVDESTAIKNLSARRTKAAIQLGKFAAYRRILTGSPVANGPLDIYAQVLFLGSNLLGFGSYYTFRAHFATLVDMTLRGRRSFKKVVGYKNLEELKTLLSRFSFIIKKEECLTLPPKVYETYDVELTAAQEKAYRQMRETAILELSSEVHVTAPLVITRLLRLHQIVCGYVNDDAGCCHPVESNRVQTLLDLLEEVAGHVIIWANYRQSIADIQKALAETYGLESVVTYYGDTTSKEREEAVRRFQGTGEARFFVANQQTGGFGLTLTRAKTVVYYANDYYYLHRIQSEDRAHRIGQVNPVTYVDLVARGTVDEKILKSLRQKRSIADAIVVSNWKELFE